MKEKCNGIIFSGKMETVNLLNSIKAIASDAPQRIAVASPLTITYEKLVEDVESFSSHFRQIEIRDKIVVSYLGDTYEQLVVILSVIEAGGVYMSLRGLNVDQFDQLLADKPALIVSMK